MHPNFNADFSGFLFTEECFRLALSAFSFVSKNEKLVHTGLLNTLLHFLMYELDNESAMHSFSFCKSASRKYKVYGEEISLMEILLSLQHSPHLADRKQLLSLVIQKLCSFEENKKLAGGDSGEEEEKKLELKRKKAQQRQQKILKKMQKTQQQFSEKVQEEVKEEEVAESGPTCCLCQLSVTDSPLGNICFAVNANLQEIEGNKEKSAELDSCRVNCFSCGHHMHEKCMKEYFYSIFLRATEGNMFEGIHLIVLDKGEFLCPLCRRVSNCILPVFKPAPVQAQNYEENSSTFSEFLQKFPSFESVQPEAEDTKNEACMKEAAVRIFSAGDKEMDVWEAQSITNEEKLAEMCSVFASVLCNKAKVVEHAFRADLSVEEIWKQDSEFVQVLANSARRYYSCLQKKEKTEQLRNQILLLFSEGASEKQNLLERDPIFLYSQICLHLSEEKRKKCQSKLVELFSSLHITQFLTFSLLKGTPSLQAAEEKKFEREEEETLEKWLKTISEKLSIDNLSLDTHNLFSSLHQSLHIFVERISVINSFLSNSSCPLNKENSSQNHFQIKKLFEARLEGGKSLHKWLSHDSIKQKMENLRFSLNPFRFFTLPSTFEELRMKHLKQVCNKCQKVPAEPAICILCGELVCAAKACCANQESELRERESYLHAQEHHGGVSIYILLRSTMCLVVRGYRKSVLPSFYLDNFGEEDRNLQRGTRLFLNQPKLQSLLLHYLRMTFDCDSIVLSFTDNESFVV